MSVRVNVASSGYLGPVNLGAAVTPANGVTKDLERNMVVAIQGTTATTLNLPAPPSGMEADWAGSVIIVKKLDPVMITISAANANIDGAANNMELDSDNQVVSFYYINTAIGWLAGPATI